MGIRNPQGPFLLFGSGPPRHAGHAGTERITPETYIQLLRAAQLAPESGEAQDTGNYSTRPETPAQTQKTASTEETAVNDDPAQHTPQEQAVIEEYKSSTSERLKSFIEKVRTLQNQDYKNKVREVIDTSTSRAANEAASLTGVDTAGYQNIINGRTVQHIDNRHGENGFADKSMANIEDFSRIGFVLDNFTDAKIVPISSLDEETAKLTKAWRNSDNTPSPLIRFSMPINGTYYVVEAVPSSKARVMAVVSAYISNAQNNSGSINQVLNMDENTPPQPTSDAMLDPVAPAKSSIPQTAQGNQAEYAGQTRQTGPLAAASEKYGRQAKDFTR